MLNLLPGLTESSKWKTDILSNNNLLFFKPDTFVMSNGQFIFIKSISSPMKNLFILLIFLVALFSCTENETPKSNPSALYFPPLSGNTWETTTPASLNWDLVKLEELKQLLKNNSSRAFILLKDGKIVVEEYFGTKITGDQPFDQSSLWYWASAGKTLTATLVGIAQEEGKLDIQKPSSDYMGNGWTSLTAAQEIKIKVWHQLTMTSGLDDGVANRDNSAPESLIYKAEPGTRWAYHNAPYTLLDKVIEGGTGKTFSQYFNEQLGSKIGINGAWQRIESNNVFFSDARSMARFGLLILANGDWDGVNVIKDKKYLDDMINPSQNINQSYGYLWWLNGKDSFMPPGVQVKVPGSYAPNAPDDMFCGLGKDGQYVCVVPSQNLVLVRLGESPDQSLVPFTFLDDIWGMLRNIIPAN
jgi:CubicO group peptidase (beta-lactamase class C family)